MSAVILLSLSCYVTLQPTWTAKLTRDKTNLVTFLHADCCWCSMGTNMLQWPHGCPMEPDVNPINTARHANIYFTANRTAENKLCRSCLIVGLLQWKSLQYLWYKAQDEEGTGYTFRKNRSRTFPNTQKRKEYSIFMLYQGTVQYSFTLVRCFANEV